MKKKKKYIKEPAITLAPKKGAPSIHEKPTHQIMSFYGMNRYTLKETAACLGMSYETLHRFLKQDPELYDSFNAGSLKAIASVSKTAFELAKSGKHPNATFRWLESNDQERWNKSYIIESKSSFDESKEKNFLEMALKDPLDESDD